MKPKTYKENNRDLKKMYSSSYIKSVEFHPQKFNSDTFSVVCLLTFFCLIENNIYNVFCF